MESVECLTSCIRYRGETHFVFGLPWIICTSSAESGSLCAVPWVAMQCLTKVRALIHTSHLALETLELSIIQWKNFEGIYAVAAGQVTPPRMLPSWQCKQPESRQYTCPNVAHKAPVNISWSSGKVLQYIYSNFRTVPPLLLLPDISSHLASKSSKLRIFQITTATESNTTTPCWPGPGHDKDLPGPCLWGETRWSSPHHRRTSVIEGRDFVLSMRGIWWIVGGLGHRVAATCCNCVQYVYDK